MNIGKENEQIEFKESLKLIKEGIISICSILNKHNSGFIYFGIKDNGDVIGLNIGKDTINHLSRDIRNGLNKKIDIEINEIKTSSTSFIEVKFKGKNIPYSAFNKYYYRIADEDLIMDDLMLKDLILNYKEDYSLWEKEDSGVKIEYADINLLKEFVKDSNELKRINYNFLDTKDVLNRLNLISGNNLNNAGNILFSSLKPVLLKLAKFAGKDRLTFLSFENYYGNAFECIKKSMEFLSSSLEWRIEFDGNIKRKEKCEIPLIALREIVVNMFSHGNYDSYYDFEIDIYKDKVVLFSPGRFPRGLTPDDYISSIKEPRMLNPIICKTFYLNETIEQFATGFERVDNATKKENIDYTYRIEDNGFYFIFYRYGYKQNKLDLTKNEQVILSILKDNPSITVKELIVKTGFGERSINRYLSSLKKLDLIERFGSDKTGYWKIK